jgi:hypothetical protein
MENTLEKIKTGKIRIENGKIIGLGLQGNNSVDIEKLNELISISDNIDCINTLCRTIACVATIHSGNATEKNEEIKTFVNENIIPVLPDASDVYLLHHMIPIFNTPQL